MRYLFIKALEVIVTSLLIAAAVFVAVVSVGTLFGGVSLGAGLPTIDGPSGTALFALEGSAPLIKFRP